MSGGRFGYENYKIHGIGQDILCEVKKFSTPHTDEYGQHYEAMPKDILDAMQQVGEELIRIDKKVHDIDYFLSGDYGDSSFRDCTKEWKI
jgi:hypothetical protein